MGSKVFLENLFSQIRARVFQDLQRKWVKREKEMKECEYLLDERGGIEALRKREEERSHFLHDLLSLLHRPKGTVRNE
jgi:hypothetical protein